MLPSPSPSSINHHPQLPPSLSCHANPNPDEAATGIPPPPFHFLPFQQRIASRRPSPLSTSLTFHSLPQDPEEDSTVSFPSDSDSAPSPSTMPCQSLLRHVLIRNALLYSIRKDREERLNQLRQAYYLPDEDESPIASPSAFSSSIQEGPKGPVDLSAPQDGREHPIDLSMEAEEGDSDALREAREEVRREMKRESRSANEQSESNSSDDESEQDDGMEADFDSEESLSDSEDYYRLKNLRYNSPISEEKPVTKLQRNTISSLTCSASVNGTSSSFASTASSFETTTRPSESMLPSKSPISTLQPDTPKRPTASPLQTKTTNVSLPRPQLSSFQSVSNSRPSFPTSRPSLSLIKEQSQSQTIESNLHFSPATKPSSTRPCRPGLKRSSISVNQIQQETRKSARCCSSSSNADGEDSVKVFHSSTRRGSDERRESEWFEDLLTELAGQEMEQAHQHASEIDPSPLDQIENEPENRNQESSASTSPTSHSTSTSNPNSTASNSPPSFSLSDSDSSEILTSYPHSPPDDLTMDSNFNSNLNSSSNSSTIPSTLSSSPSLQRSISNEVTLTKDLDFGISAWRNATRASSCEDRERLSWAGRSFSFQDERFEKLDRRNCEASKGERAKMDLASLRSSSDSLLL